LGILKGPISYAKFYVTGDLPEGYQDRFLESIALRRFVPLTVEGEDVQSIGWAPLARPHENDVGFDHNEVFFNSYLNAVLRIDEWKFPSAVFKAAFDEAAKKHLTERGREKLTRREKDELKVVVSRRLRNQFTPVMRTIDLSWNLSTNVLRFWNQSARMEEILVEIFEKTFAPCKLMVASPYTMALQAGLSEQQLQVLQTIEPTAFHSLTT
jgi:DNA recombination-dependent growth factor C